MAKGKIRCNMCGKDFNNCDSAFDFGIHRIIGYGSKYDGDDIDLDLCPECFDKFIHRLKEDCRIDPIVEAI